MNGYMIYGLGTTILAPIVGFLVYKWRARVDLDSQEEGVAIKAKSAAIDAQAIPLQILQQELAKRESELALLRQQDHEERVKLIETLTMINDNMKVIGTELAKVVSEQSAQKMELVAIRAKLNVQSPGSA